MKVEITHNGSSFVLECEKSTIPYYDSKSGVEFANFLLDVMGNMMQADNKEEVEVDKV